MLCHNFLIGRGHTCALRTTCVWRIHVRTRVRTYVRTYVHVYIRTYVRTNWYVLIVPWYVLEYHTSAVVWPYHWYHGTRVRTNITLSQKQLEIQALRCNGDTIAIVGVVSIEGITVYYS